MSTGFWKVQSLSFLRKHTLILATFTLPQRFGFNLYSMLLGALNIHSYTISTFFLVFTYDAQNRLAMDFSYAFIVFDLLSVFFLFNFTKYYWIIPLLYCGYNVYGLVEQEDSVFSMGNIGVGALGLLLAFNCKFKSAAFGVIYFFVSLWGYSDYNIGKPPVIFVRSVWYYIIRLEHRKIVQSKQKATKKLSIIKRKKASSIETSSAQTVEMDSKTSTKVESQASFENL
ncbi:hypothetical protein HDV06_006426 [Boothiomyces sp. JEL0866]|nr:hypothetical protein HDV06_006426 [Boothiomyces sp. JEL0866]